MIRGIPSPPSKPILERLSVLASVLMIGAHPDDEDPVVLAFLSRNRGARGAFNLTADEPLTSAELAQVGGIRLIRVAPPVLRAARTALAGLNRFVDTGLDAASPWPKSHRDLRNTGNSAAPLP